MDKNVKQEMDDFTILLEKMSGVRQKADLIRGSIIGKVVTIERIVDQILAEYFTSDKSKASELRETILSTNKISFESKRDVLFEVFDKQGFDWKTRCPDLKKHFLYMIETRNVVAHLDVEYFNGNIENFEEQIIFTKVKKGISYVSISNQTLKDFSEKADYCTAGILLFTGRFPFEGYGLLPSTEK